MQEQNKKTIFSKKKMFLCAFILCNIVLLIIVMILISTNPIAYANSFTSLLSANGDPSVEKIILTEDITINENTVLTKPLETDMNVSITVELAVKLDCSNVDCKFNGNIINRGAVILGENSIVNSVIGSGLYVLGSSAIVYSLDQFNMVNGDNAISDIAINSNITINQSLYFYKNTVISHNIVVTVSEGVAVNGTAKLLTINGGIINEGLLDFTNQMPIGNGEIANNGTMLLSSMLNDSISLSQQGYIQMDILTEELLCLALKDSRYNKLYVVSSIENENLDINVSGGVFMNIASDITLTANKLTNNGEIVNNGNIIVNSFSGSQIIEECNSTFVVINLDN